MSIGTSAGVSTTSKIGKHNRPKRSASNEQKGPTARCYPITDSFASKQIPPYAERRGGSTKRRSFAKK